MTDLSALQSQIEAAWTPVTASASAPRARSATPCNRRWT